VWHIWGTSGTRGRRLDSPRIKLIRKLFELMETNDLARASEELLAHSADDEVFEPRAAHGRLIHGKEEMRRFWAEIADEGVQTRAGAYSITEEGDSVVVTGWVRTTKEGRLADAQVRWVYRFNEDDQVVSARVESG
jgi:ketosteroid isomerase-like protein